EDGREGETEAIHTRAPGVRGRGIDAASSDGWRTGVASGVVRDMASARPARTEGTGCDPAHSQVQRRDGPAIEMTAGPSSVAMWPYCCCCVTSSAVTRV